MIDAIKSWLGARRVLAEEQSKLSEAEARIADLEAVIHTQWEHIDWLRAKLKLTPVATLVNELGAVHRDDWRT